VWEEEWGGGWGGVVLGGGRGPGRFMKPKVAERTLEKE